MYFCREDPKWGEAHVREQCRHGAECESLVVDPRFADPKRGDFRLLPDSPAHEMGIMPLKVSAISRTAFPFNE
jgi:hypothetical protein